MQSHANIEHTEKKKKKEEVVDGRRTSEEGERESSPFAIGIQKEP